MRSVKLLAPLAVMLLLAISLSLTPALAGKAPAAENKGGRPDCVALAQAEKTEAVAARTLLNCRHALDGLGLQREAANATLTRGQLATMIYLAFDLPDFTPTVPTFRDVPASNAYYVAVETVYYRNIMSGLSRSKCASIGAAYPCFGPNLPIDRSELASDLKAAASLPDFTPSTNSFADVPPRYWAYTSIETINFSRIMDGYRCGNAACFRPDNQPSFDELLIAFYRAITYRH